MPVAMGGASPEAWVSAVTHHRSALELHSGFPMLVLVLCLPCFSVAAWIISDFLVFSTLLFKGARQIFVVL